MSKAKLALWWIKMNLKPMVREAARMIPMRTIGEALVSYGVNIMVGDGANREEVSAVVEAAFVEPAKPA